VGEAKKDGLDRTRLRQLALKRGSNTMDRDLIIDLQNVADKHFNGHVTIVKSPTNWRISFGAPASGHTWEGRTFSETAEAALLDYCGEIPPPANP